MIWKNRLISLLVFLTILANQSVLSQVNTNLNILNDRYVKPILLVLDSVNTAGQSVQIVSRVTNNMSRWVEERLRSELLKKEIPVFLENKNIEEPVHNLFIQNLGVQIYYIPISKNILLRNSEYQRNIETILSYYIKENDESIIYSYSKIDHMIDTLKTSQLKGIENNFYDFTRGKKVESGWIRKFFEPALITITTIGVVYLFYALRSG